MTSVAATAIPLATWARLEARRDRFHRLADEHRSRIICTIRVGMSPGHYGVLPWTPKGAFVHRDQADLDLWRLGLVRKYREAADRPWLPVSRDPEPPRLSGGLRSDRVGSSGAIPVGNGRLAPDQGGIP